MSSSLSVNGLEKRTAFSGKKEKVQFSPTEKYLNDIKKAVKTQEDGNFSAKYTWSETAGLVAFGPYFGYGLWALKKFKNAIKNAEKKVIKQAKNKFVKQLTIGYFAALAVYAGLEFIFSRNKDKKYEQFVKEFKDINTNTSAKLHNQKIRSNVIGALCSPVGEEVTFNQNMVIDPMKRRKLKKMVKHELVHAKQYETIARSKDGIRKLNYSFLYSSAKIINNPTAKAEIAAIYKELSEDKSGKFDNIKIHMVGADVDLKKYIEAMYKLLNGEVSGYHDELPMVIDEKHYQKVRQEKGPLTEAEEKKAQLYYDAQINYPTISFFNLMNPFSDYYGNLLEREAYKENPNFMTFIRHLFIKE